MIIKKWSTANGGQWVEQYPKTIHTQIFSANDTGVKIFNDNGTLKNQYLPDTVFGGMTFVGTVEYNTANLGNLETLIIGGSSGWTLSSTLDAYTGKSYANDDYDDIGQKYIGHYWIVGGTSTLGVVDASLDNEADFRAGALDDGIPKIGQAPFTLNVEPGDWLVITGWDNTNKTFTFNVVNNTYQDASTSGKGVVEFADDAEITAGTATNKVMSVEKLFANFADANHEHTTGDISSGPLTNIGTSTGENLTNVFTALDAIIGTQNSNITTNANDIGDLQGRKEVFVSTSVNEPTANQANDIWFEI